METNEEKKSLYVEHNMNLCQKKIIKYHRKASNELNTNEKIAAKFN